MDKHRTSTTFDDIISRETSRYSKNVTLHRHANARMVKNVLLIWLDHTINEETDANCRNIVTQLRRHVNIVKTFNNGDQCIKFLNQINDERTCVIISGSLGQRTVPRIHDLSHIESIFIFCGNKSIHEVWSKEWPKIKGVFTEITPICESLKQTVQQCVQNSISFSFAATDGGASIKTFEEIYPLFISTQVLKEIILTMKFEDKDIKKFTDYCHIVLADNKAELKNLDILERKYHETTPIWWHTYECFLYPMLNRGLRSIDVNIITKMGFFIQDLHRQIEELHKEQFNGSDTDNCFTVFHGQGVPKPVFEKMTKTKSGLISFNSLLCASKDRRISCDFAHRAIVNPDLIGIFFVMTINPSKSTTPFAFINNVTNFEGKDEVLFSIHTVFRIREIESMGENNRLFQINLTLTSDTDEDLRAITDFIHEETFPNSKGWDRFGQLLIKMNRLDKAQQIYEIMLEETINENEKANIYYQFGRIKENQTAYKEAITFYEKSIEIYQTTLPLNNPDLAASYEGIGSVYGKMGEPSKSGQFYEKALEIWQKSLPANHTNFAACYEKVSLAYFKMGDYSKILPFYERAVDMGQNSLPSNNPLLEKLLKNLEALKKKIVN
jgi:hypothetical protein